ncbi:MAG: InlB B-repeat-containing protein [Saprospiraceae bacterium]
MKTIKSFRVVLSTWGPHIIRAIFGIAVFLIAIFLFASPPPPPTEQLKVMKTGLGSGTVSSSPAGINCGGTCDGTFTTGDLVTLTAVADLGSTFVGWEGDASGATNPITVTMSADRSVRAVFDLTTPIPTLTNFTAAGIQAYLTANPIVNTPARFVKALPTEYKQNWILMTRSESLQTGTAEFPRVLLPSANAQFVFSIGLATHASYPGSHPLAIEYMQWDAAEKNFRFHEIVLDAIPVMGSVPARTRSVSIDDSKCSKCHSTQNVLNRSAFPGTTGLPPAVPPAEVVKSKNKPNWDSYDSWAGMMPLNRDRIYQGSVEAAAFRKIFNLWTWRTNDPVRAIIEQLELQPPGVPPAHVITRTNGGVNDGHINFVFDVSPPVLIEPVPVGSVAPISTNYSFDGIASTGASTSVTRGGSFVTLHHSIIPTSDEGRGVRFFDALGGLAGDLNQKRIADELVSHRFATGSVPIDIRPIALAITKELLSISGTTVVSNVPLKPLTIDLGFFAARNGGLTIDNFVTDTETRAYSIPRRKADFQKINLDRTDDVYLNAIEPPTNGLIQQYGAATSAGATPTMSILRQEIFRRFRDAGFNDRTVMGGIYVDRELATNIETVALYRYFLGPLGVSVDKWSMGVRGRSRTYTFADVFDTYLDVFQPELIASLTSNPVPGLANPNDDGQLIDAVNLTLASLPLANAVPTYTDIQRIFNKSCIECHGGLDYPPYVNYSSFLDFSEEENPPAGDARLTRSNNRAMLVTTNNPATSSLYQRLILTNEDCSSLSVQLMPCGGPALCITDIETIRRWIVGSRPFTNGDPHIRTVDGVNYDFQAAGEFVLLRGENLEIQARHKAVGTNSALGPNAYTGLTSCVSLNSAVAIKVGKHRITYQPNLSGEPDPSGLQLRVDSKLVQMNPQGIPLASGGRIMPTTAPGGIQIEAPGGTVIVVTPGWWNHYKVWYLNIDAHHVRATEGLMGSIPPGSWLPALPDGSFMGPKPKDLQLRYNDLYGKFGNAWRVNDSISLFDYATGTSTKTFSLEDWPRGESPQSCEAPESDEINALAPLTREVAERLCAKIVDTDRKANAIQDVMVTGEAGFAQTYLLADQIAQNSYPEAPVLVYPEDFMKNLGTSITFKWNKTIDKDGNSLTYKHYVWPVNEAPNINNAILVGSQTSWLGDWGNSCTLIAALIGILLFVLLYFLGMKKKPRLLALAAILILAAVICAHFFCRSKISSKTVSGLEPDKAYFWKVIVEDGRGGVTESETRRFETK